jgi:hypothetical protein
VAPTIQYNVVSSSYNARPRQETRISTFYCSPIGRYLEPASLQGYKMKLGNQLWAKPHPLGGMWLAECIRHKNSRTVTHVDTQQDSEVLRFLSGGYIIHIVTTAVGLRLIHTWYAMPMPRPCRAALIHTCHAAPLPFSDSAVSFVKVRVVAGNIRTASPTV